MNIDQYIDKLSTQRRRRIYGSFIFFSVCILISLFVVTVLGFIVQYPSWFNLNDATTSYMGKTIFYEFSLKELRNILVAESGTADQLNAMVIIYWATHIAGLYFIFLSFRFLIYLEGLKKSSKSYKNGLVIIADIQNKIDDYILEPSRFKKIVLTTMISVFRPCLSITPLSPFWYRRELNQWFPTKNLQEDLRDALETLNFFDGALSRAVRYEWRLVEFKNAMNLLKDFYYSVALRSDPFLKAHTNLSSSTTDEFELLYKFSLAARPLIRDPKRPRPQKGKSFSLVIRNIILAPVVRNGAILAGIAGFVMTIGVFLFKIDSSQAFLTWFAVAFGSITISFGISSVSIIKQEKESKSEGTETLRSKNDDQGLTTE